MMKKLSHQEAQKILVGADLPGVALRDLKFALTTKSERLDTIRKGEDEEDMRSAAAIEIQRIWRGYLTRCMLFDILHPSASMISTTIDSRLMQSTPTAPHSTPLPSDTVQGPSVRSSTLPRTKRKYKEFCERTVAEQGPSCDLISYREFCAILIQQWWRLMLLKPVLPRAPPPTIDRDLSTDTISLKMSQETNQRTGTGQTDDSLDKKVLDRNEAAGIIQRNWRKHIDIQVYRYYRDLISFKWRGDPSLMLKCINPREAELLDAAAGIHVKFRLAGEKFPPNIYYKIFTHRNIVDVCANAPRDYTQAASKRLPAEYRHNKRKDIEDDDRASWYQRWENNGWRLVSDRLIKKVDQDPVVYESTLKKEPFCHNKLVRRQDVEIKRKKKKVEWMKKMYKEGMLKARQGEDATTEQVVQSVAEGMFTVAAVNGRDAIEDWEVDELLQWTNGLNFDQYIYDWKEIATSAASEFQKEQTKFLPDDPFSLTLLSR